MFRIHILSLLIATAALSGCTEPEEIDNPFTRFRGEVFETLQLEVDAGGDLLVMTSLGMVYEYQGKDSAQVRSTRTRNYHSVLYRRTKGSWNATPFRNIQEYLNYLPALVPDAEGRYHAFIRDAEKKLRYRYEGAEWVRAVAGRIESTVDPIFRGPGRQLRTIAPKDDSSVVFCRVERGKGIEVHGVAGARGSFILDTNSNTKINEIRAMPGFVGILGNKSFPIKDDKWGNTYNSRATYWYWHPEDSAATTVFLPDSAYEQFSFVRYRNGIGILMVRLDGFYLQPLSSDGTPGERIFLAERNFRQMALDTVIDDSSKSSGAPEGYTRPQSYYQVEVDAKGCVHVLDRQSLWQIEEKFQVEYGKGLYYANSCSSPREEEIPLPMDGLGNTWPNIHVHAADMRIDAEGKVRVAVIQKTGNLYDEPNFPYIPSRLLIAELGEDGWTVEVVATK